MCKVCEAMSATRMLPKREHRVDPYSRIQLEIYLDYLRKRIHERKIIEGKAGQTSLF